MFCLFRWCYKLIGSKVGTYRLPDGGFCVQKSEGAAPGYGDTVFQTGCHLHTRTFSDRVAMTGAHALEIGL